MDAKASPASLFVSVTSCSSSAVSRWAGGTDSSRRDSSPSGSVTSARLLGLLTCIDGRRARVLELRLNESAPSPPPDFGGEPRTEPRRGVVDERRGLGDSAITCTFSDGPFPPSL